MKIVDRSPQAVSFHYSLCTKHGKVSIALQLQENELDTAQWKNHDCFHKVK
jgi:hypothetical protein